MNRELIDEMNTKLSQKFHEILDVELQKATGGWHGSVDRSVSDAKLVLRTIRTLAQCQRMLEQHEEETVSLVSMDR